MVSEDLLCSARVLHKSHFYLLWVKGDVFVSVGTSSAAILFFQGLYHC